MCRFPLKTFICGVVFGILLAVLLQRPTKLEKHDAEKPFKLAMEKQRKLRPYQSKIPFDNLRYGSERYFLESQRLKNKIPILCLIIVRSQKNFLSAKGTWARDCNALQTLNLTKTNRKLPAIRSKNVRKPSWDQLCEHLQDVPKTQKWIFIVNDSVFVIMENLRLFLSGLNPHKKYYFGHPRKFWSTTYNSAQAGIILSRGTLDALKHFKCRSEHIYNNKEDYYLGKVLHSLDIQPGDGTDLKGLSIFNPSNINKVLTNQGLNNYVEAADQKCCSDHLVSFHAIDGDKMYTYYYLLYTLQLFHFGNKGNKPAKPPPDSEVWGAFLKSRNIPTNVTSDQYYRIWKEIIDEPSVFVQHLKDENGSE